MSQPSGTNSLKGFLTEGPFLILDCQRTLRYHGRESVRDLGGYSNGVPPLPIPNREVKPIHADGTAEMWESR